MRFPTLAEIIVYIRFSLRLPTHPFICSTHHTLIHAGISSLPIPQYNLVIIVMFGMLAGLIGGISAAAPLSEYYSSHNNIHHPSFSISRLASTTTALPLTPAAAAPPPPSSSPSSHTTIPVLPPSAQTVIHFGDGASAEGKEEGNAGKGSGKAFADASRGITYANPIGYSAGTGVLCISPIVSSLEQSKVLFWAMNRGDFSCDLPAKCVDCDGIVLNHVPTAQSSAAVKQAVSQYNLDVDASTPPTFLLWTNDVEAQLAGFLHSGLLFLGLPFLVFPVAAMTMVGFSLLFAVMNMKVFDHRV